MKKTVKKILVLGSGSFAARGLIAALTEAGHDVRTFHRGQTGRDGTKIAGDITRLTEHPLLVDAFDVVINYVILKGEDLKANAAYMEELLKFCSQCGAERLIHISSVSVYSEQVRHVVEEGVFESVPENKGAYGAVKVMQDLILQQRGNRTLDVVYIRPGFILGAGLENPIIGMALRLGGFLVQLGSGCNVVPVITRALVNEAVVKSSVQKFNSSDQVIMVVDKNSPSRKEWLAECCSVAGWGRRVISLPAWTWRFVGWGGDLAVRILRKQIKPKQIVANMLREMTYDASKSEALLQMNYSINWRSELRYALKENGEAV